MKQWLTERCPELAEWQIDLIVDESRYNENTKLIKQALGALESFLRCPSIGNNGPGSSTIVIQDFNLRRAASVIIALKERLNE